MNGPRFCVFLLAAVLLVLTGCVPIKNVVERWDASEVDESIIGSWKDVEQDLQTVVRMHDDGYAIQHAPNDLEATPDLVIRTFEVGDLDFLLFVGYEAVSSDFDETVVDNATCGIVLGYHFDGEDMVWTALRQEVLAEAINTGVVVGEMVEGEPALDTLDDATAQWLAEAFADTDNLDEEKTLTLSRVNDD